MFTATHTQCSAGSSLNEPPPNWPSIFWRPFFSRHPSKQSLLSFSRHCPQSSSVLAIYVTLSSLNLPLRQRIHVYGLSLPIRPFRSPFTRWWSLLPPWVPRSWVRGLSVPALHTHLTGWAKIRSTYTDYFVWFIYMLNTCSLFAHISNSAIDHMLPISCWWKI